MKQKIYIAGKVTGLEEQARGIFLAAEIELLERGFEPVNPMTLRHDHNKSWESYMKEAITAMLTCDGILMLRGWEQSKGATIEHRLAQQLGISIIYQSLMAQTTNV